MILNLVVKTVEKWGLLKEGDRVLVACSGGADSTALLSVLFDLRREYSLDLALAHFNHLLRRRAMADERFVVGLARKYDLPLYLRREDIRAHAASQGMNIEEAGRMRRYEFLRRTSAKISGSKIATGHTMTDQAETLLMRLLRGSGRRGLGGISPIVDGLIVRPLLEVEHEDVLAYLLARGLAFRTDESNLDRRYLRNRIRLELVPYLKKNFAPSVVLQLSRLAEVFRAEEAFLDSAARAERPRIMTEKNDRIILDAGALTGLLPALARRCVRDFLTLVKGDLRGISFGDVESILKLKDKKELHLRGKLILARERGCIFSRSETVPHRAYQYSWNGKKPLEIKEAALRFAGRSVPRAETAPPVFDDSRRAYLDSSKLHFPLTVRSRLEGDRYRPLGAPGRKKLKEIMRARGIPADLRPRLPVFVSGGKIVWVPGLPVAEEFKVGARVRRVFIIERT
jgi:tRNA(Ile)-lysidine synthase